jgi:hypothetical protein
MLILRKSHVELIGKEKLLLTHLYLDADTRGIISGWERFFRGEIRVKKPWIGEVDIDKKKFELVRARVGIFQTSFSLITIKGNVIQSGERRLFDVNFGIDWYSVIVFSLITFFLISFGFFAFHEIFEWLIMSLIWILWILFLYADFKKTIDLFNKYLEITTDAVSAQTLSG